VSLSIRVLLVEDNPADAELVLYALHSAGFEPDWHRVDTEPEYLARLDNGLDIVLSDFSMPQFSGLRALELLIARGLDVPFISISGTMGEEAAVEVMRRGATDYLLKDRLGRLGPAVQQALDQARLRKERRQLEEQFRQAQKMEAIGQLAGGVAHDFNNILTIIQSYAALLEDGTMDGAEAGREISAAVERGAGLSRQLLTFSRKQVMEPRDLDLNAVVTDMTKMLRRTLGTNLTLVVETAPNLPLIHADRGMMEQILLNLAVNARDAMPNGGQLSIATGPAWITETDRQSHPEAPKGPGVCLCVSDDGCGIAPENLDQIFEPFFTTKDVTKGTGLGLATVHSIVKQHHGWIRLSSKLGEGTTFEIVLPARR
jgi:signal transduction histidine kinase